MRVADLPELVRTPRKDEYDQEDRIGVKGITFINKRIQYRIHATDRVDADHGLIIVDLDLEEFSSRITVFESGKVIVKTPDRNIQILLAEGELQCD